jgi:hypothetical protein
MLYSITIEIPCSWSTNENPNKDSYIVDLTLDYEKIEESQKIKKSLIPVFTSILNIVNFIRRVQGSKNTKAHQWIAYCKHKPWKCLFASNVFFFTN